MVQHEEEDEQQEIDQEDQQDRRTEEEQVAFSQVEEEYGVNENNHPFENEAEAVEATLPSSESTINNNDIYAVECILDKKKRKNKPYYLVQWKGYLQSTWEPQENIHLYIKRAFDAKKTASWNNEYH